MTQQYLQYVRQELITATADLSGATKGQLVAWAENAQFDTCRLKRKRRRIRDEVTGKMITMTGDPVPGQQSRAKGSSIALVKPVEYSTASWRRAVMSMDEHQNAWLLWNYSENVRFEYQVAITRWAWAEFNAQIGARKIAGKTRERLKALIWLAAQDTKATLSGRDPYQYADLAALVGVTKSNWSQNYVEHWECMVSIFKRLDSQSLIQVSRSRSQQKTTNYQQGIA
ncbi:bacteriophage antitermination protein Q [Atlantibacter hermannii]|uniref:bacteriophage antitermination protein Q n=1 Tax=Atlantibacter hermannii TaxID=565 RepID=UPI00289A93EE|nr:bacteriophage antitermination protein Q [Atlantibacter hermannii]